MPTMTSTLSLIERCSFLQSAGCCETFEFGSASFGSSFGSDSSIGCVRLMTHTTLPRHSTSIFWPGSSLPMSTSTGAPAALARSLGKNDITNGVAAADDADAADDARSRRSGSGASPGPPCLPP